MTIENDRTTAPGSANQQTTASRHQTERERMVGREQAFTRRVAELVQCGDAHALADLYVAEGDSEWEALNSVPPARIKWRDGSDLRESGMTPPWCSAANAIVHLGRAVVEATAPDELLVAAFAHWERAACTSVGGTDIVVADISTFGPALHGVVQVLRRGAAGPAAGFAVLMAAHLVDELPAVTRSVTVPVLVSRSKRGAVATLQLQLRASGPTGLHPDPARMPFLITDTAFTDSIRTAWASSPLSRSSACVTWSVHERDQPCNDVYGPSLGAAFAVALDELHRCQRWWVPRLRKFDPKWAVTGKLEQDRTISSVSDYREKMEAAASENLHVVLPAGSTDETSSLASQLSVPVKRVRTIDEAVAATRTQWDKWVAAGIALVIIFVLFGAGTAIYASSTQQAAREMAERGRVSSDLAARATTLRRTDPRVAGLLGLAAQRLDPTNPRAVDAIRGVLADNTGIARSWIASASSVDGLAVDDPNGRVYTTGSEGTIRSWDLNTGTLVGELSATAQRLELNPSVPVLAAEQDGTVELFETSSPTPTPLGTLPVASCVGDRETVQYMGFTSGGVELILAWSDGAFASYDVTTRQLLRCQTLAAVAAADQIGMTATGGLVLDATLAPAATEDQLLLLLNTNRVLTIGLRSNVVTTEIEAADIPGDASLIRASAERLAVGTAGGVMFWDRAARRLLAFPAGGIAVAPTAMEVRYQVAVAGPEGTARLSGTATDINRGLSRPTGGASTIVGIGSSGTIVAGEAGGRVVVLTDGAGIIGLPPARPSTVARFADDHTILLAEHFYSGSNAIGLYAADLGAGVPTSYAGGLDYPRTADYGINGEIYINDVDSTADYVAAAGLTGRGGAVSVWDSTGRQFIRELLLPPPDDATRTSDRRIISALAFVPDAELLVARHVSGQVGIWSTRTWELQGTVNLPEGTTAMAVRGTKGVFAAGKRDSRELVLVDLVSQQVLVRAPAPDVFSLSWTFDGSQIVGLTIDNKIKVFTGDLQPTNGGWSLPPGDPSTNLEASPVGPQVAITQGSRVLVYDLISRTEALPTLEEPTGQTVINIDWSPDGRMIAGTTMPPEREFKEPGSVNFWQLDGLDWRAEICRLAGGGLTPDEWNRYVGDSAEFTDLCEG